MAFPYNDQDQILTQQAILAGVAGVSGGQGVLRVSSLTSGGSVTLDGDAANNRVSAIQEGANRLRVSALVDSGSVSAKSNDAAQFRISSFVDSGSVSAKSNDAAQFRASAFSNDAALMRVSTIGAAGGDGAIQDGADNTIEATVQRVSGVVSSGANTLVTYPQNRNDAAELKVSGYSNNANTFRVSAFSNNAAGFRVSSFIDSGSVSAKSSDAGTMLVSAKQGDAGTLLVSAKQGDAALLRVSGIVDSGSVSAQSNNAAQFRVSAFLDAGSVSAKSNDAAQLRVSAFSNDGATMLVSAKSGDGNQLHTSAVQGDAALLRVSAFQSVVAINTGGASYYMVSSGATSQVSTVKSSAGRLYGYHIGNPAGVDQYLQIFNTSGGATAGTDTPALTLFVPTLGGAVMSLGAGIAFSAGIQIIGTSTANGQTIGASAMRANFFYA